MNKNEYYIRECIKLAKKGSGFVSPNPLVGCIIEKGNNVIGKGFHEVYGYNHAEINAINDAKINGFKLRGATLYVNLEPCNHYGKTPPCTDIIISEKIGTVVIGIKDPNNKVKGNGIGKLEKSGIKVIQNILAGECIEVNKFFIKFVTKKLPYITLKVAQSLDGKIALSNFNSKWITNEKSRKYVHRLRSNYDAILIGKNTALYDNPSLTTGDAKGRNPQRFVIDKNSELPLNLKIYKDDNNLNTYTFIKSRLSESKNKQLKNTNKISLKEINHNFSLKQILKTIYSLGISSLLVEGGGNLFGLFIKENLFDDIYFIIAPKIIGKGITYSDDIWLAKLSDAKLLNLEKVITSDEDIILYYKNINRKK